MVLHPAFMHYVRSAWLQIKRSYPSTGFLVLMFALHICDEVKLLRVTYHVASLTRVCVLVLMSTTFAGVFSCLRSVCLALARTVKVIGITISKTCPRVSNALVNTLEGLRKQSS